MSSADEQAARAGQLIERLIVDGAFRAEFRRDPAAACRASGLDGLAAELGSGGNALYTLEARESKSSLAGVVMAAAAEGVGAAQLRGLLGHGLHSPAHAAAVGGLKAGGGQPPPAGVAGAAGAAGGGATAGVGSAGAGPGAAAASASAGESAGGASAYAPKGTGGAGAIGGGASAATTWAGDGGVGRGQSPVGSGPVGGISLPGGEPAPGIGDVSPAGGGVLLGQSPGGSGSASLSELLSSPRLSMPSDMRATLAKGSVDPRLVSVLVSTVANHNVVIGDMQVITDPVHAQAIDIVSVDGQVMGPDNVAARDLVAEIAALDPSVRPSEIGTPWPIQSRGFFTDSLHQDRLHLGFVSEADYQPNEAVGGVAAGGVSPAGTPDPAVAGVGPVAATPAAAGVAQAADAALAAPSVPGAGEVLADGSIPASSNLNFASPKAHAAFEAARSQLGVRYQWGGTSPQTGFDCSGLMQWAYGRNGIRIPRVAADQFHVGTPVDLQHLREGDLVFFQDRTGYIHHVGMYVGNHVFLEAPHSGDVVKYADLRDSYWAQQFAGGRRIAPLASEPAAATQGASEVGAAPQVEAGLPDVGVSPAPIPAAPPPKPGTAVFKALQRQEHSFHRQTVQFMAAVQPAPYSPLYGQAPASPPGSPVAAALDAALGGIGDTTYPGDNAPKSAIAGWMANVAQQHGLPRELPVMAALVESSLHNDPGGDRDSVGYFQMRVGIWNNGQYAGYPNNPALQLQWFIDHALEVKNQRLASDPSLANDPNAYGEWIADVERPAAQYRYRYQLQLGAARALLSER